MKTCGYEEETSFEILQAIISPEIREKISRKRTTVTALEKLKELVYTETKGKELLNELKTIIMTKKENVKNFYKRFQEIRKKVDVCCKKTEVLAIREAMEMFAKAIPYWMQNEIHRHPSTGVDDLLNILESLQNFGFEKADTRGFNNSDQAKRQEQNNYYERIPENSNYRNRGLPRDRKNTWQRKGNINLLIENTLKSTL